MRLVFPRAAMLVLALCLGLGRPAHAGVLSDLEYVVSLYAKVLGRGASPEELFAHAANLESGKVSRAGLAHAFLTSREFYTQLVTSYYVKFLGRTPDAGGLQNFVDQLVRGADKYAIQAAFLSSPEFFQRVGGTPSALYRAIYWFALGRRITDGELANRLATDRPEIRYVAARDVFRSREYTSYQVVRYYTFYLDRQPAPEEVQTTTDGLIAGDYSDEQAQATFVDSAEYDTVASDQMDNQTLSDAGTIVTFDMPDPSQELDFSDNSGDAGSSEDPA